MLGGSHGMSLAQIFLWSYPIVYLWYVNPDHHDHAQNLLVVRHLLVLDRSYTPGTYSVELLNKGERIATERLVLKP